MSDPWGVFVIIMVFMVAGMMVGIAIGRSERRDQ
jgi:hypothetical protein